MSEQYLVSARKYRPASFATVVGQQQLTATLKGAIGSGRLAHAYLFCGPRGVGKTSCARIFAKTINCLNPTADGEACGQCESCRAIDRGTSFNLMELDAASNNSVDNIRAITDQVNVPPQVGKYRVFIIDEVHMLSAAAFNAFLKTLEEPPSYVIFILATTEKHKVLPTILSRCQIYDFKRITINDIVDHLEYVAKSEGIETDRRALGVIARKADGAMRDALSIFDQVSTSTGGKFDYDRAVANLNVLDYEYFFSLVETFAKGDAPGALLLYKEIRDRGFDSLFFVNSLAQHVRDLMVAADPRTVGLLETPEDISGRLVEQARTLPLKWYYAAMKVLNDCDLNYRTSSNKQLLVELALIRLCQLQNPAQGPFDLTDRPIPLRNPLPEGSRPAAPQQQSDARSVSRQSTSETRNPGSPKQPVENPQLQNPQPANPKPPTQTTQLSQPAQPAQSSQPAPARGRRPGSHGSVRFEEMKATATSLERKRNPFNEEDFKKAWSGLSGKVVNQQILDTAIRNGIIKRVSDEEYLLLVEHPMQQTTFETHSAKILEFLRSQLGNDFLSVRAELNPEKEIIKFLPPKEFLGKTVKENPMLGTFLNTLDIELS